MDHSSDGYVDIIVIDMYVHLSIEMTQNYHLISKLYLKMQDNISYVLQLSEYVPGAGTPQEKKYIS